MIIVIEHRVDLGEFRRALEAARERIRVFARRTREIALRLNKPICLEEEPVVVDEPAEYFEAADAPTDQDSPEVWARSRGPPGIRRLDTQTRRLGVSPGRH